jgi:hypothetical protein
MKSYKIGQDFGARNHVGVHNVESDRIRYRIDGPGYNETLEYTMNIVRKTST